MPQVYSQVAALELERVSKKLPVLFERDSTFYSQIAKGSAEKVSNREMRVPMEIRPGGRPGHFDPDGGDLGRGDASTYDRALVSVAHLKYAVEFTKKGKWGTDSDAKAIKSSVRDTVAKSMASFRRFNDALFMQNGNGVLGTISAIASQTYTLNSDGFGAKLLQFGQYVNIYDTTLATNRTSGGEKYIVGLDLAAKTITVDSAVAGVTVGDKVVVSGVSGASPASIFGVPYHISDASTGTWLGYNRANFPEVRANSVDAASSALSLNQARLLMNKIGDRLGSDNEYMSGIQAWMHPAQDHAHENLAQLYMNIQKQAKEENVNLYFGKGKQLAGADAKVSFAWNQFRIDFFNPKVFGRAEMYPMDFYKSEDGRTMFEIRGSSGGIATADIFYYIVGHQLFCYNPAATGFIKNLTVPSGY